MSTQAVMSTAKGWGRSCSSGRTPWVPVTRRSRISMRSFTTWSLGGVAGGHALHLGEELTPGGAHGVPDHLLDQGDGLGQVGDAPGPHEVARGDAHRAVAQFVLVHEDAQARGEGVVDVLVAGEQDGPGVAGALERVVGPGQALLVIGGEVVRGREQGDDPPEALDAQPDDLLLAADPPVVDAETARPLADREVVLDDPGEVAGRDAGGPLALHAAGPYSRVSWTVAATSWTRTMPVPATRAAAVVAME